MSLIDPSWVGDQLLPPHILRGSISQRRTTRAMLHEPSVFCLWWMSSHSMHESFQTRIVHCITHVRVWPSAGGLLVR